MSTSDDPWVDEDAGASFDRTLFGRLLGYARPHARLFVLTFGVLAAVFALELALPALLRGAIDGPVQDALRARASAPETYEPAPHLRELWMWAGAYLACTALLFWLRAQEVAQLGRASQAVVHDLRARLFAHMQRMDLSWFDRRPTGSLVTRVTSDIENLNEMLTSGLVVLLFDVLKIAVVLVVLFTLDWRLASVVVALTPVLIGISLVFRGGARDAHRGVRKCLSDLNGYLQEALSGIRVVQVFRRERHVSQRFAGHLGRYLAANVRTVFLFALFFPAIDFVVTGIQGTSVWVGGELIVGQRLTYGLFLQFWFYLAMLLDPIRELGERYNILQSAFASAERVFGILDTRPSIAAPRGALAPAEFRGHVRFEHVSFAYPGGPPVLEDVSFEIAPGRTIAVVGATGAGKSTLVNLLLRFYDPTAGRITIDGIDLRELDLAVLRRHLGLVLQEDFLFTGSVRHNLVLDRAEVDEAALARALETSTASEVVARLPSGLDSPVAERGVTLSTGERELIAMARALAGDPRLVVLDEATSSVDSGTEARIERATRRLLRGRAALVIAHRLPTVREADEILVMHRGRLRERGTHAELLAQRGIYARLHAMQFRAEPAAPASAAAETKAAPASSPTGARR